MLQESSNTTFIFAIILSECHVTLQLSTLFPTKLKQKSVERTNIIIGFLLSSAASRACIPSECSFSLVWSCPSCPPLLLFKMASICKLLRSPLLSWFASQQKLFAKSVQPLMVVISFIFLLPLIHNSTKTDCRVKMLLIFSLASNFFFSHCGYSQLNHFVHYFNFSLFTKS